MSNVFAALGDIQCDVEHHSASFTFADVKMHLMDDLCFVDEALLSWEKYNQALEQLDAAMEIIKSSNYQLDPGLMSIINKDNQLGQLLGVYIPPALRFEQADPQTTTTNDAAKTDDKKDNTDTGKSVVDKAKDLGKKIWEMIKSLFGKIAQGLRSFWQWIKNGFQSSKNSNMKLLAAIQAMDQAKYNEAVGKAKGYLKPSDWPASKTVCQKITEAPIIKALDDADCSKVLISLNKEGWFGATIDKLLGIDTGVLASALIKVTPAEGEGKFPTIELNKEEIANRKKNNASMSANEWTKEVVTDMINGLNAYYDNISKQKGVVAFIDKASTYDWENSPVAKGNAEGAGADPKKAKAQAQAVCKFYTQYNKLLLICCNMWQDHLNAIKKYMNVDAGQTAANNGTTGTVIDQPAGQTNAANGAATQTTATQTQTPADKG